MLTDEYVRHAKLIKVIDGDTIDVDTDLGCDIHLNQRIRFNGMNAPEMRTAEGKAAKAFLQGLLEGQEHLVIKTHKDRKEKYGRYLGDIFLPGNDVSINQQMVAAGHAVAYTM